MQVDSPERVTAKLYDLLPPVDQKIYDAIKKDAKDEGCFILKTTFQNLYQRVKSFCTQSDGQNKIRCYVCGLCWFPNGLAINFRQFKCLVPILKSTTNSMLQKLGFNSTKCLPKHTNYLMEYLPELISDPRERKSWTIYEFVAATPMISTETIMLQAALSPEPMADPPVTQESDFQKAPAPQDIDSFFDDPFSLPPIFLVEDAQNGPLETSYGGF